MLLSSCCTAIIMHCSEPFTGSGLNLTTGILKLGLYLGLNLSSCSLFKSVFLPLKELF